jgi:hypothetical protein
MKTHYVECICKSKEHIMRVIYDSHYKEYYIEYSLNKFAHTTLLNNTTKPFINHFSSGLMYKIKVIKSYFINLWHSIKGLPNIYSADIILNAHEAKKLAQFLIERK